MLSMRADEAVPTAGTNASQRLANVLSRPGSLVLGSTFWGWAGPVLIMVFGGFLRFYRLSKPNAVVFDETYYVPDTYSILHHGVELNHVQSPRSNPNFFNSLLLKGDTNFLLKTGEVVAHPPLGKLMMAVGQWTFGLTPFGWRFSCAVVGTVSILMIARIARRMTRSTLLGCVAGLLLALDGLELVLSRTAILDIFLMFWVLAAFGLLVIDRDMTRDRLAAAAAHADDAQGNVRETVPKLGTGPKLGIRWVRVAAGACLGAAVATKWNGLYYLIAFGGMAILWDLGARKAAGFSSWLDGGLRHDAKWLPAWFGVVPLAVYAASWSGWFATTDGYDRNWAAQHGNHAPIWSTIDSWYQYNHWMLQFGLGLDATQNYSSNPVGWLILARPISFHYYGTTNCGSKCTSSEVLAIGTPFIWWAGTLALIFCLGWWLIGLVGDLVFDRKPQRDWRAGAVLLGVLAGWLPWVWFAWHDHRTEFYYYAIAFDPFLIIAITLCLGLIIGPASASRARRAIGAAAAGAYLLAVLLDFAYIYPVLTAEVIPYSAWLSRMWFSRWI
jgi:dolichyl-phosphate-mannose-protein mannosyltransferase